MVREFFVAKSDREYEGRVIQKFVEDEAREAIKDGFVGPGHWIDYSITYACGGNGTKIYVELERRVGEVPTWSRYCTSYDLGKLPLALAVEAMSE